MSKDIAVGEDFCFSFFGNLKGVVLCGQTVARRVTTVGLITEADDKEQLSSRGRRARRRYDAEGRALRRDLGSRCSHAKTHGNSAAS